MLFKSSRTDTIEVGVDEAGRGCLMGPVVAAAVMLPASLDHTSWNEVRDSKKITEKKRTILAEIIKQEAFSYGIGVAHAEEVDEMNILQATFRAMHRALDECHKKCTDNNQSAFNHILVDGPHFRRYMSPGYDDDEVISFECKEKGDDTFLSIAAASILAKDYRDRWVLNIVEQIPDLDKYNFKKNKGYGTKAHIDAVQKYGITQYHRKTFKPISLFM